MDDKDKYIDIPKVHSKRKVHFSSNTFSLNSFHWIHWDILSYFILQLQFLRKKLNLWRKVCF